MHITAIETIPVRVPIDPALAIKSGRGGTHSTSPFLLLRVHTDQAHVGLGEVSCTPKWSGEDQVTAAHFINAYFAPLLVGESIERIEDIDRLTDKFTFPVAGNAFTKSGVEMALWDLLGKATGRPVYDLLGGPVRDVVPTKWSVSGTSPELAAGIARRAVERGFRKMKVKVGIDPEGDVARVGAVRGAVGPDVNIGVDANGGWSDAGTAIATIARLRAFDIAFVEQPLPAGETEAMAQVRRECGVPVIADESMYSLRDARSLARAQACDVFSVYTGKSGGILPARRIAEFAQSAGIACTIGSNLELGVGSAAMIHLALATPGIAAETYACDIIGPMYYEDDVLAEPLPLRGGEARAPAGPGLGVTLDDRKVAKYRVG